MIIKITKYIWLGSLAFISLVHADSRLETEAKTYAVEVYLLHQQVKVVSDMCEEPIPESSYPLMLKGPKLIAEKMRISLQNFEEILRDETDYVTNLKERLDEYDCLFRDNKLVLETLIKDYDMAVFRLDIAAELDEPIISQKEWSSGYDNRIKEAIKEYYEEAYVVALGVLLKREFVPSDIAQDSLYSTNKYWYRFDKGWKSSISEYLVEINSYFIDEKLENVPDEGLNLLFFVDRRNNIFEMVALENEESVIEKLSNPSWYYSNGELTVSQRQ
jgi:hypothetical protein